MGSMFQRASSFSSNLYSWGLRLFEDVEVDNMFVDSGCPSVASPEDMNSGPWCYHSESSLPEL